MNYPMIMGLESRRFKGGEGSGWFGPPKGTHQGRIIGFSDLPESTQDSFFPYIKDMPREIVQRSFPPMVSNPSQDELNQLIKDFERQGLTSFAHTKPKTGLMIIVENTENRSGYLICYRPSTTRGLEKALPDVMVAKNIKKIMQFVRATADPTWAKEKERDWIFLRGNLKED